MTAAAGAVRSRIARLAGAVALVWAAVLGAQLSIGVAPRDTGLDSTGAFFEYRQGTDSWKPMNGAYDFATTPEGRTRTLYQRWFFNPPTPHKGFQYPPTALLFVEAARLGGRDAEGATAVMKASSWLCVIVAIAAVHLLLLGLVPPEERTAGTRALLFAFAAFATLTFFPFMQAFRGGQAQIWLNTFFLVAALAWVNGRSLAAGGLLALGALVKPQWGLFLLWGLVRGEWRFAAAFGAVFLAGGALSVGLYGLAPHLEYARVASFIAERGEAYHPNQSMNGLLNRLLGNGDSIDFGPRMPPPHPVVAAGTWLTSLALIAAVLWRRPPGPSWRDFCAVGLVATLASPIAWEHHHGALLPVFALLGGAFFLAPGHHGAERPSPLARTAVIAAWVVASQPHRATTLLPDPPLNLVQSSLFFGTIAVLAVLFLPDRSAGPGAPRPPLPKLARRLLEPFRRNRSMSHKTDVPRLTTALLFLAVVGSAGPAQEPRQPLTFGATSEMVYVRFHVEKKGVFTGSLRAGQIRVTEDGRPQTISVLQTPSMTERVLPTEITLALDVSSSVLDAQLFDEALVRDVVIAGLGNDARVRLCAFGGELSCPTPATRDVDELMRGFEEALLFGRRTRLQGTRLYDSLVDIFRGEGAAGGAKREDQKDLQRAVVVITDGLDNRGGDVKDAVAAGVETGARAYAVKVARAFQDSSPFGGRGFDRPRAMYDYRKFDLDALAKETGGRTWEPAAIDRDRLAAILKEIATEITMENIVGFVPEGPPTGRKRRVKVELLDKSLGTLRNGERAIVR